MANYVLPEEGFNELLSRISKINKKYGTKIFTKIVKKSFTKDDRGIEYPLVEFSLTGEKPLLGTHEFLAVKQIDGDHALLFGPLVEEVPKEFWSATMNNCDHCSTKRMRKNLVILRNRETGEIVQVGKTCLKEYIQSLEEEIEKIYRATALYEFIESFSREYSPSSGYVVFDAKKYLGFCCAETKENGYISASEAMDNSIVSTKEICRRKYLEFLNDDIPEKFRNQDLVEKIVAWWLGQTNREDDPFWLNVAGILKDGFLNEKALGMVAFLPSAYEKHLERVRRADNRFKFSDQYPSGVAIGGTIERVLVLRRRSYFENSFSYYGGLTGCYQFSDDAGHCFVWKTSAKEVLDDIDLDANVKILLTGKVKDFSEYKGTKQTVLTRCKVKIL